MTPEQLAKSGTEHAEQRALFAWANMAAKYGLHAADSVTPYTVKGDAQLCLNNWNDAEPRLKWLHAIHNQGHGDAIRGSVAKAEGVKAGVADVFLPVPKPYCLGGISYEYHGLYIEMKKKTGGIQSDIQKDFQADMIEAGYQCVVCNGWLVARNVIMDYLG